MGNEVPRTGFSARLNLRWPRWYPLSADDRLKEAQAIATLINAGQISHETAVKSLAANHAVTDVSAELRRIDLEQGEA